MAETLSTKPLIISMHEADNVAIVANDGGLPAGTVLANGLVLKDHVPQAHRRIFPRMLAEPNDDQISLALTYLDIASHSPSP